MSQEVMQAMQHWINQIVMGEGLCPFARTSILNNHFAMQMSQADSFEGAYQDFLGGLQHFASDHGEHLESAALVVPYALGDFDEYLECLGACEQAIEDSGLSGEVQLASFHPQYVFDGNELDDHANWTNRAPYPVFHYLREGPMAAALKRFPKPEMIPERNMAHFRGKSKEEIQKLFSFSSTY